MKNAIILSFGIVVVAALIMASIGTAKTKAYYSGDATNYQGQILVATTNTGSLEIFALDNDQLTLAAKIQANDSKWHTFYDAKFDQDNGRLYVYVTSGRYLYKYDATNLDHLILLNQVKDNSWDWFGALDKADGYLITKGSKFIRLWNSDLQVVDSYRLTNQTNPYNIRFGYDYKFIYNVDQGNLQIFDRSQREVVKTIALKFRDAAGNHQVHPDRYDNMIYVMDDEGLKKFSIFGGFYNIMEHDSGLGYDVVYSSDGDTVYASNGQKVFKVAKSDLGLVKTFANADLGVEGSWAMGLKTVQTDSGEKLVVFNNSNILILNSDLQPVAKALSTEDEDRAITSEQLWLNLSSAQAVIGQVITVNGGGFATGEDLVITLGQQTIKTTADNDGRFNALIRVPEVKFKEADQPVRQDVKVVGQKSNLRYSASLIIEPVLTTETTNTETEN